MEWHEIRDPQDTELDRLAERYRLHPLHIEDCRHRHQNAKVEETRGYLFAVLKTVQVAEDGSLSVADLDVFLGRDFIITVEESTQNACRHMIEQARAAATGKRADEAFYRVADGVVDTYLPVLDHFSDVIDELEDEVLDRPTPEQLSRIFDTKRSLIMLRRVLVNTRDLATHLQRSESELIHRDLWPFLRDVYDHVARNLDLVEMQRDLLTGTLDIYLSSVANRTNQVMKVLTIMGTIFIPLTFLAGVYGMNMPIPENQSTWTYPIFWLICIATVVGMLRVFKRRRWL